MLVKSMFNELDSPHSDKLWLQANLATLTATNNAATPNKLLKRQNYLKRKIDAIKTKQD